MATNLPLMGGYCLYGISTLLLVLALKDGELSLLYPVIALTYVWVTVLSFLIFHDDINPVETGGHRAHRLGRGGAWAKAASVEDPGQQHAAGAIGRFHRLVRRGLPEIRRRSSYARAGCTWSSRASRPSSTGAWHPALALFLLSSYFFVLGIRPPGELSVLYPMVSVGYIFTLLWSRIFFKEPLTRVKFIGLFVIVLGVVFVGLGSK